MNAIQIQALPARINSDQNGFVKYVLRPVSGANIRLREAETWSSIIAGRYVTSSDRYIWGHRENLWLAYETIHKKVNLSKMALPQDELQFSTLLSPKIAPDTGPNVILWPF